MHILYCVTMLGQNMALTHFKTAGLKIPIFCKNNARPAMVVRVGSMYQDYQRHGFFRIGMLPMVVAENVIIEIRQNSFVTEAFSQCHILLNSGHQNKRMIEFRNLKIISLDSPNCLEASNVQIATDGQWALFGEVKWTIDGIQYISSNKTLYLKDFPESETKQKNNRLSLNLLFPETLENPNRNKIKTN